MATENLGWGAPRIHGELLKLGNHISERTVSWLMPRQHKPRSQTWRTFLANHAGTLACIDFFTVPTASFRVLYVFLVLSVDRRRGRALERNLRSQRRLGRPANYRRISGRHGPELPPARPRWCLRSRV